MSGLESLPDFLREALRRELGDAETIRWAAQPLASRVFRQVIGVGIASLIVMLAPLGGMAYLSVDIMRETVGTPARDEALPSLAALGGLALLVAALGAIGVYEPWRARRRAERTAYAVTDRRVIVVRLGRHGRARVVSLEPVHPMLVVRHEHRDGSGDVMIGRRARMYDTPTPPPGGLVLAATPDPRRVDRIIRRTFDPPAPGRDGAQR